MEPTVLLPPVIPLTLHVTPVLLVFVTFAVNCCFLPTRTVALDGEREIELSATSVVEVHLRDDGPFVVDVPAAMEAAARAGHLHR